MMKHFKFEKDFDRFLLMHPIALMIMFDMLNYSNLHEKEFIITSTVSTESEDIELGRKSITHRTGRAFDISIKGWKDSYIELFKSHFGAKYFEFGAVNEQGYSRLIIDHKGSARHLHVQIHSDYSQNLKGKI